MCFVMIDSELVLVLSLLIDSNALDQRQIFLQCGSRIGLHSCTHDSDVSVECIGIQL